MSLRPDVTPTLPSHDQLIDDLSTLELDIDVSHLHGLLTGLIVAGASEQAENFLRSLILNKTGPAFHQSTNALFSIYTVTQTWLNNFGFEFEMILPEIDIGLPERIMAFSNWCLGFLEGLQMSGLSLDDFENEDDIEILQHFEDFSQMDVEDLDFDNEDEKAYVDVTDYARLAVLQLFCDLNQHEEGQAVPAHH
jgi:uncharacterized protein YgfB (UPF0149 family)